MSEPLGEATGSPLPSLSPSAAAEAVAKPPELPSTSVHVNPQDVVPPTYQAMDDLKENALVSSTCILKAV